MVALDTNVGNLVSKLQKHRNRILESALFSGYDVYEETSTGGILHEYPLKKDRPRLILSLIFKKDRVTWVLKKRE